MAVASEFQHEETVRILIDAGSDVRAEAKDGETVTSWADKWSPNGLLPLLGQRPAHVTAPAAPEPMLAPTETKTRAAAEKALSLLQSSSAEFFRKSGCSGCHHQMLTGMATKLGRQRGLAVDETLAAADIRAQVAVRMPERELLLQGIPVGGAPMAHSLLLVSLAAQEYPQDPFTAALTHFLAGAQSEDGSWRGLLNVRQPLQYSDVTNTAYAIRALQVYAPAGRKAEYAARIERARKWLRARHPVLNEERAKQLLGLMWAGDKSEALRAAVSTLRSEQRPDGGWAQRPGFPSDAYATGQTLYALNQAGGVRLDDPGYKKGVSFLLRTQLHDGSWHVRSRSPKVQPYFESGFPHGHDQWISAAASAWAAMALTLAVEPAAAPR
jgi:hypothetical protein